MLAIAANLGAIGLTVTVGVDSVAYTSGSNQGNTAVSLMVNLLAWLNAAGRPWFGAAVFSWTWERYGLDGGAQITLSATAAFSLSAIAGNNPLAISAIGPTVAAQFGVALGTWAPKQGNGRLSVTGNFGHLAGNGDAGGSGACRAGVPGTALHKLKLSAVGTTIDAIRLAGQLKLATSPRLAHVWQTHTATWLVVALGSAQRSEPSRALWQFEFEAMAL